MKLTNPAEYVRQLRKDTTKLFKLIEGLNYTIIENDANLGSKIDKLGKRLDDSQSREQVTSGQINQILQELEDIRIRNAELEHSINLVKGSTSAASTAPRTTTPVPELFAENHELDAFYLEFENKFRGTESEIQEKQKPYIKLFDDNPTNKKLPVVDIGCGRGEFLELLKANKYACVGVDLNESMVERAQKKGFEAVNDDAIGYLSKQKSGSLSGVTGFHLAEHIPFDQLLTLIAEAYRCLAKGGILLLETPNPESLFVGAFTFHYDPSHLKPLPPAIVQFAARFKGFERADILRLQPELTPEQIIAATKNTTLQDALGRLYGPRDYALVAYK